MLDILEIAREDGMEQGWQKGKLEGKLEGRLEGRLEGTLKGKAESRFEMAKGFKQDGIDLAIISKHSGLSIEKIKEL